MTDPLQAGKLRAGLATQPPTWNVLLTGGKGWSTSSCLICKENCHEILQLNMDTCTPSKTYINC